MSTALNKKSKKEIVNAILGQETVIIFKTFFESTLEVFSVHNSKKTFENNSFFEMRDNEKNNYELSLNVYKLIKKINASKTVLISAFILVDRLVSLNREVISRNSLSNICKIAVVLTQKFLEDIVYDDESYAYALQMPVKHFAYLETSFLNLVDYSLFISNKDFYVYCDFLLTSIKNNQKIKESH